MSTIEKVDAQKTIEGSLERIDLASVLQVLQNNGSEGTLEIQTDSSTVTLFYSAPIGLMLAKSADALGTKLLSRLLHRDRINHEQYDHVLCECKESVRNAIDVLCEMEILDENHLVDSLRETIEEDIYSLFFIEQGSFRFHPVPFDAREHWQITALEPLGVPADRIVLEAARRIDEWTILRKKIPDLRALFRQNEERCQEIGFPDDWMERLVLSLIDSRKSLHEIAGLCALSPFELCRTVDRLADTGWIAPLDGEELQRLGERHLKKNEVESAAKYLEQALAQGEPAPELHRLLARCYEQDDRLADAARHCLQACDLHVQAGAPEEAFTDVTRAADLVPSDLAVRERKLEVFLAYAEELSIPRRSMVEETITVSRRLVEADRIDTAVDLLRRLDRIERDNLAIKSEMIEILLNRGLLTEAIAEYEKLGSFLVARGQFDDARKIFRKILSLDHRRLDIAEKLKRIERMRSDQQGRRRRLRFALAVVLFLLAAGLGYHLYARVASERIAQILARIRKQPSAAPDRSIEELRRLEGAFPFAPARKSVDDEIRRLEFEKSQERVDRSLAAKVREEEATQSLDRAVDSIETGDLDEALLHLQRAIDLSPTPKWVAERELEEQKENILSYLREAEDVYRRSRQAIQDGDTSLGYRLTRSLLRDYGKSPFARTALLPIRLESEPEGAAVSLNGQAPVDTTPCTVLIDPRSENRVTLTLAGHFPVEARPVRLDAERLRFVLSRTPRWEFATGGPVAGRPAAARGVLYLGSRDATVYAVDPSESKLLWSRHLGRLSDIESPIELEGEVLYFGANDRTLNAMDAETGAVLWSQATFGFVKRSPFVSEDAVFAICTRNSIYRVDKASGEPRWKVALRSTPVSDLALSGGRFVVATKAGALVHLDPETGRIEARHDVRTGLLSAALLTPGLLVAGTADGRIVRIDPGSGGIRWSARASAPVRGLAAFGDGALYAGDDSGALYKIAVQDGRELARFRVVRGSIQAPPMLHGERVYFGTTHGEVYALSARNLDLEWKAKCGGAVLSSPFEAYGEIYVGCDDHRVYAFEP